MRRRRTTTELAISAMVILGAAAASAQTVTQPNILIISLDTVRADHTSAYGYERKTTPNLDAFAEQGVIFEQAYAPMSTTGPSHGALFTAEYPVALGMLKNGMPLKEEFTTLAERLLEANYETAGFISSWVLKRALGFGQGFEHYDERFDAANPKSRAEPEQGAERGAGYLRWGPLTTRAALNWMLQRDTSRPFFMFVHYYDAHAPYRPRLNFKELFPFEAPDPTPAETTIRRYDQEIAYVDNEIGRLLQNLQVSGLANDTVVIVVADHGEGMFDHGVVTHGANIYEESVRVPLVIRWPGKIPPGTRIAQPVELLDVMPTLLRYVGLAEAGATHPRDLGALIAGRVDSNPDRPVFLHRRHHAAGAKKLNLVGEMDGESRVAPSISVAGQLFSLRRGPWKYIEGAAEQRQELYNLDADPGELDNVIASNVDRALELATELHDWLRENQAAQSHEDLVLRDEDREALEALGYVQ